LIRVDDRVEEEKLEKKEEHPEVYKLPKEVNDIINKKPSPVKVKETGYKDLLSYGKVKDPRRLDPRLLQYNLPYGKIRDGSGARMKQKKHWKEYGMPINGNLL
jgi:hypothetical protein